MKYKIIQQSIMKYNEVIKCTVKIHLMPNSAVIPELYLDFNNDAVKYAKRAHRYKKHPTYSLFITGVRGSGKTVFMNKVGKELNKYDDTIRSNSS